MRMYLVEVFEGARQLQQYRVGVAEVHARDAIAPECVDETLDHSVALRRTHWRVDRRQAKRARHRMRIVRDVGAAVVAQELQQVSRWNGLHGAKAFLHGFDQYLAHRFARQALFFQPRCAIVSRSQQSFTNVTVTVSPESHLISKPSEHQRISLASTETVPSCLRCDLARLGALGSSSLCAAITRCARLWLTREPPVLPRSRLTKAQHGVAIAGQLGNLLADLGNEFGIALGRAAGAPIDPLPAAMKQVAGAGRHRLSFRGSVRTARRRPNRGDRLHRARRKAAVEVPRRVQAVLSADGPEAAKRTRPGGLPKTQVDRRAA